jgi:hypothetical protein
LFDVRATPLWLPRQQARIAAGCRGVDGDRLLGGEARQVVRAAGLGAGAGQALAAERLHADHRADLVAVDVDVADLRARAMRSMVSSMREWMPRVRP